MRFRAQFLALLALVALAALCAAARKQPKSVSITRAEMCQGCKLTLDAYIAAIKAEAEDKKRRRLDPRDHEISGNRIAERLCSQPPFTDKYTDAMRYACLKVTEEHQAELLSLFAGKQVNIFLDRSQTEIFHHRQELCLTIDACDPDEFLFNGPWGRCGGCKLLARTVDKYFQAHKQMTKEELTEFAEGLCSNMTREFGPRVSGWFADTCFDLMDEWAEKIAGVLNLRRKAAEKGFVMNTPVERSVCYELTQFCSEADDQAQEL